jgi:integrase
MIARSSVLPLSISNRYSRVEELITTHTAHPTFVTQSLERGIRPEIIMKITGHKDIKTMLKYVKITDNVVRAEMMRRLK